MKPLLLLSVHLPIEYRSQQHWCWGARVGRVRYIVAQQLTFSLTFCPNSETPLSPVYTIQTVVKSVVKPVKCLYTRYNRLSNRLSNPFDNRFDNRLYRVNGVLEISPPPSRTLTPRGHIPWVTAGPQFIS